MILNNSQEQLDDYMAKCRICWEEEGKKISPCKCSGTAQYVHEDCLKKWFEKGVTQKILKVKDEINGISSTKCEICKGQISFRSCKVKGCLPSEQVKHRINQNCAHFICKIIAQLCFFAVMATLILRLIDAIVYNAGIANHIILSILLAVGVFVYIRFFIPMLTNYCWGQGIIQIEFIKKQKKQQPSLLPINQIHVKQSPIRKQSKTYNLEQLQ